MLNKHINIFIVGTSYQLITALNFILSFYGSDKFENHIYIEITNGYRFKPNVPKNHRNIFFKKFIFSDWVKIILELLKFKPNHFYFFQERNILSKYLSYHFKKKGTTIGLCPDGSKPYGLFNKSHEFLSMLKDTLTDYLFLFKNNLYLPRLYWSKYYRYGSFELIDENWVPFAGMFNAKHNQSKGQLKQLPDLTEENLFHIAKIINIETDPQFNGSDCVLYFNQPLWSEKLIQKDVEIINKLVQKIKERKFYIKLHPSTSNEIIKEYLKIPGTSIINDSVPAEFYIAQCKQSILITGWSAALMHKIGINNESFYLFPIFKELGDPILNQIQLIGFPHVELVSDLNKLYIKL